MHREDDGLPGDANRLNPASWVDDHGDVLYRYALARVRSTLVAEDLVQDTLLAALRCKDTFRGKASERTWLTGILKNKIFDHFRKAGREAPFSDLEFFSHELQGKFDDEGFWDHDLGPQEWQPIREGIGRREFWEAVNSCLENLPPRIAQVFLLRELEDMPGKEICRMVEISETNFWVILHRARMALRECLEKNWFGN